MSALKYFTLANIFWGYGFMGTKIFFNHYQPNTT